MMNGFEYAGMDMVLASSFRAAIYCRLSKDDDLDGESASIANQRAMLETYCEKQGWEVVAVYQDDGYTGPVSYTHLFFLNERGRVTYNDLCRKCQRTCKQSFRAVIVDLSLIHI